MDSALIIDSANGKLYYVGFYFLAFLTGLIILIYEGRIRKFPMLYWLLVIATSFLFFLAGTQIVKFNAEDWNRVWQFEPLTHSPGRSVLGGIIFGTIGLLLAKYSFRFKYSVMDSFAWAAPIGMILQRLGCLMAGCCYGTPTAMPWGIQYGSGSHAFVQHANENLINVSDKFSLVIHPVAIYEILGTILAIIVLYRIKKHLTQSGNLFLASLVLYGVVRFITEFFRENSIGSNWLNGLSLVQIVLLFIVPTIAFVVIYRESKKSYETSSSTNNSNIKRPLIGFFIVNVIFALIAKWLTPLEIVTLNLIYIPLLLYVSWKAFNQFTVPAMQAITLLLLGGSLVMMSQTLPETSKSDSTRRSYHILSIGTMSGKSNVELTDVTNDCNGGSSTSKYNLDHVFSSTGAGYTRVQEQGFGQVLQYGIDFYKGYHRETVQDVNNNQTYKHSVDILGIHPYVQYDWPLLAAGLGFHAGTMSIMRSPTYTSNVNFTNEPTMQRRITLFPSAYFRVGYVSKFFGEIKLGQQFPSPFPTQAFQTNLGFGFRKYNGGAIRIGSASYAGLVLGPTLPLGRNALVDLNIAAFPSLFGPVFNNGFEDIKQKQNVSGSITLRLKLGYKSY